MLRHTAGSRTICGQPCAFDDAVDDKVSAAAETNLSLLMREMLEYGYQGQKVMTDAQEFGLPCRRRSLYVFLCAKIQADSGWTERPLARFSPPFAKW